MEEVIAHLQQLPLKPKKHKSVALQRFYVFLVWV
jgi:hypothetical protein